MRYFFISDVHGEYNDMIKALTKAGFNKETDTLVSLGDPFDRGVDNELVLDFFLSCPNRILVWGNHDYRLYELLYHPSRLNKYDKENGILFTFLSFDKDFRGNTWDACYKLKSNPQLQQYFNECVCAVQWSDLIGVHGWLPYEDLTYTLIKTNITKKDWIEAFWANTQLLVNKKVFPKIKVICGHWHACRLRGIDSITKDYSINFDIYETDNYIAIDGCTNYSHQVNVYIYETDEEPQLIDFTQKSIDL